MSSSLIPERPLLISPTLAATIGLEEAVMLHVLSELMLRQPEQSWLHLDGKALIDAMPFWNLTDIRRVQTNLVEKGLIEVDGSGRAFQIAISQPGSRTQTPPPASKPETPVSAGGRATQIPAEWQPNADLYHLCEKRNITRSFIDEHVRLFVISQQERNKAQYSWHNTFYKYIVREWENSRSQQGLKELEANMSPEWQPGEDAISILEHAGINHSFIEDTIPEFVLYWRETGLKTSTWNTKFIAHVRRQWAKFEAALEHYAAPKLLPEDYQPSDEVYDVLELANIDLRFAQELIPEFILYWRERKEVSSSWHTKYLQHVKYRWSHRHEDKGDFVERVTDRSWAD
jgi:hypothetical protein